MLAQFLTTEIFAYVTVFARIGAALMLMPPFGDVFVFARTRLALALALSAVVVPLAGPALPRLPEGPFALTLILGGEIGIGLFIGGLARLLLSGLHTASMLVAYQTGLGAATMFDPSQNEQGAIIGRFFSMLALVLLFATDLHHALILALVDSYRALPPGGFPPAGDFAQQAMSFMSGAFVVAVQVAAPVLVVGLLFYLGLGLLGRLMPTMQVFFVALPLQIMLGFWVVMVALSAMMLWYFEYFEDGVGRLLLVG